MTRAALLVVVLAALCYTSQAVPVQTENAQVELSNETINELSINIGEILNDFINKLKDRMKNLEYEFQVAKFEGENRLQEKIESLKKLLQEKKITLKDFLERIREEQKIETDYQLSLSVGMKLGKSVLKIIGRKVVVPMVKGKIQEKLNKRRSGTYGIMEKIGGEIDKKIKEGFDKIDEITEKGFNEAEKKIKDIEKRKNELLDGIKGKITGENYQQPQPALLGNIIKEVGNVVEGVLGGVSDLTQGLGKNINNLLDGIADGLGNLKPKPKEKKKPEDGNKTDKNEEKEKSIETSGQEN